MIIFLDIDGVLNKYSKHIKETDEIIKGTGEFEGLIGMEPEYIENLNGVIDKFEDVSIVISSSWHYDFEEECRTQRAFKHFGFRHIDRIIDVTPRQSCGRGQQIKDWIDENNYKGKFVVIEDEPFDVYGDHETVTDELRELFKDVTISPNPYIGLNSEKTFELEEMLRNL